MSWSSTTEKKRYNKIKAQDLVRKGEKGFANEEMTVRGGKRGGNAMLITGVKKTRKANKKGNGLLKIWNKPDHLS